MGKITFGKTKNLILNHLNFLEYLFLVTSNNEHQERHERGRDDGYGGKLTKNWRFWPVRAQNFFEFRKSDFL